MNCLQRSLLDYKFKTKFILLNFIIIMLQGYAETTKLISISKGQNKLYVSTHLLQLQTQDMLYIVKVVNTPLTKLPYLDSVV